MTKKMNEVEGWRGRFYDDLVVGDLYRFPLGRTVTEADNVWFTMLTLNTNQIHFNADYASRTEFGRPLVNSGLTVALVLGMSVQDVSQNVLANLGWKEIELRHPVFVGDTLYVESVVLSKRPSKSRPEVGIVSVKTRGLNQEGQECISFIRSFLVYRREAGLKVQLFPDPVEPFEAHFQERDPE
jgi:itaconyl-CoA hydratase